MIHSLCRAAALIDANSMVDLAPPLSARGRGLVHALTRSPVAPRAPGQRCLDEVKGRRRGRVGYEAKDHQALGRTRTSRLRSQLPGSASACCRETLLQFDDRFFKRFATLARSSAAPSQPDMPIPPYPWLDRHPDALRRPPAAAKEQRHTTGPAALRHRATQALCSARLGVAADLRGRNPRAVPEAVPGSRPCARHADRTFQRHHRHATRARRNLARRGPSSYFTRGTLWSSCCPCLSFCPPLHLPPSQPSHTGGCEHHHSPPSASTLPRAYLGKPRTSPSSALFALAAERLIFLVLVIASRQLLHEGSRSGPYPDGVCIYICPFVREGALLPAIR